MIVNWVSKHMACSALDRRTVGTDVEMHVLVDDNHTDFMDGETDRFEGDDTQNINIVTEANTDEDGIGKRVAETVNCANLLMACGPIGPYDNAKDHSTRSDIVNTLIETEHGNRSIEQRPVAMADDKIRHGSGASNDPCGGEKFCSPSAQSNQSTLNNPEIHHEFSSSRSDCDLEFGDVEHSYLVGAGG